MNEMIQTTPLPYRIHRGSDVVASSTYASSDEHNISIARQLFWKHGLQVGDVLVMDLVGSSGEVVAQIGFRFEKHGVPKAIKV